MNNHRITMNLNGSSLTNGQRADGAKLMELQRLVEQQSARINEVSAKLDRLLNSHERRNHAAAVEPVNGQARIQPADRNRSWPRLGKLEYEKLVRKVHNLLTRTLPPGAAVAIISRGDDDLLSATGLQCSHFPQDQVGSYVGYHPGSSGEAILYLEAVLRNGVEYLVVPRTAYWWLDFYTDFNQHLSEFHTKILDEPECCVIYRLDLKSGAVRSQTIAKQPSSTADAIPFSGSTRLFDVEWYRRQCPDAAADGVDLLTHYWTLGWRAGHDPHPLFDSDWYLEQNPDVAASDANPLGHYLREGARQGRSPHPLFDAKFYIKSYPEAVVSGQSPLEHYLNEGWKKGHRPNRKFDPSFYLATYPDVHAAGLEPLSHFVSGGLKQGRMGDPAELSLESFQPSIKIPRSADAIDVATDETIRAIAFYLPQFHPIRENNRWWGKGFTEWTNVRRGRPQFRTHYQPHVPSTLGYYDLRNPEMLEQQAALAQANGIHGFCFYYYWFGGKILLDRPLRNMLARGKPTFPFCLCWANENWTRRWDGLDQEILIAQQHSSEDDLAFLRQIEPMLVHPNYIRVQGKPLFVVYRPGILPDANATTARWREHFRRHGHGELFLAMTQSFGDRASPAEYGFDAAIQFPPHTPTRPVTFLLPGKKKTFRGSAYDYEQTKLAYLKQLETCFDPLLFPGVMPSWDNTPRRPHAAHLWVNSSPESYCDWLAKVADHFRRTRPAEKRLVFINAWNEWGEGCHLEPDRRHEHAWLNATKIALRRDVDGDVTITPTRKKATSIERKNALVKAPLEIAFVAHDAFPHGAQYALLTLVTWLKEQGLVHPRFLAAGPGPLLEDFAQLGPVLRLDLISGDGQKNDQRVRRLLQSFCGQDLSAVYVNSAAAGHVCRWTKHLAVPHIAHIHELEESIRRWAGPRRMALLRKTVDRFIAASDPVARNLIVQHGISGDRMITVHESIRCTGIREIGSADRRRCRSWLGLDPKARIILGCGTTDWRKGPDLFIDVAARTLQHSKVPIQFVWVGAQCANEKAELQRLLNRKKLNRSVQFVGAVASPLPYMLAADLFLLPSREDPFPLVCLEAADCGLPTVCFAKAGGMPEFVATDCGAVVPYLNVDRMARAVLALLTDDARRIACGQRARAKVRTHFDVSIKGREIYQILEILCAERKVARGTP